MINIRALNKFIIKSFLPLLPLILYADPTIEIRIPDLSPQYQKALMEIWTQNQNHHIRIDIISDQSFKVEIMQQVSIMSTIFNSVKKTGTLLTNSKNLFFWLAHISFGGGVLSYVTLLYFIYRAYRIATKLYDIYHLIIHNNKDEKEDTLEIVDKMFFRSLNRSESIIQNNELQILQQYYILSNSLKKLHIRFLFPYNEELEKLIEYCIVRCQIKVAQV
jgi:hypothetical protein